MVRSTAANLLARPCPWWSLSHFGSVQLQVTVLASAKDHIIFFLIGTHNVSYHDDFR